MYSILLLQLCLNHHFFDHLIFTLMYHFYTIFNPKEKPVWEKIQNKNRFYEYEKKLYFPFLKFFPISFLVIIEFQIIFIFTLNALFMHFQLILY